jgi:hypothetical protein
MTKSNDAEKSASSNQVEDVISDDFAQREIVYKVFEWRKTLPDVLCVMLLSELLPTNSIMHGETAFDRNWVTLHSDAVRDCEEASAV